MSSNREGRQWDKLYQETDCLWGLEPDWELRALLPIIPKGRALDLGIGEGRNGLYLARNGFQVEGLDVSAEAVAKCNALAQQHSLPVSARVADLKEFDIANGAYNCIVCAYVLPFLERSEAAMIIARIEAGLAAGGVAFVAAFTTEDPLYQRCLDAGLQQVAKNTFFSSKHLRHLLFFATGELKEFAGELEILSYVEGYSLDVTHDQPHYHGWTSMVARNRHLTVCD